ncbi:MAG: DNA helicase RecQ [Planctomycetaceae bacterium]
MSAQPDPVLAALKKIFGFAAFRANQESIVRAIIAGRDVFAVMPTGGGKSLCYQLPSHLMAGTCVVISPLISLMKDQVDGAKGTGLHAEFLNSAMDDTARRGVYHRLRAGELDLLYVSPERLAMDHFIAALRESKICLFAVDEAHCISEWGHDFRPDYLQLSQLVKAFKDVPVAAFTATATHRVQEDVIARLGLRRPHVTRASFDRPNLFYEVQTKGDLDRQLLKFIKAHADESGIVYRTTRKDVEATAAALKSGGIKALPYHAGLTPETRRKNQEAFNNDKVQVVVATIAFGMGIDKSNVRFVVHGDLPKNMEGYYQETGRAGRDGEAARCLLFFSRADIPKIRYFIDAIEDDTLRAAAAAQLSGMVRYATASACRRAQLLAYFGETYPHDNCQACDVCSGNVELIEATVEAQILMSAVARTGERFGANHVVDVVIGANTERIRSLGHDQIKTYGAGKDRGDKRAWLNIVDNLIAQQCLLVAGDRYPVLGLSDKGRDVLFGRATFKVLRRTEEPAAKVRVRKGRSAGTSEAAAPITDYDPDLFQKLREVRSALAFERGVPPYVVFSDRTLHEMARDLPTTPQALLEITGVGQKKLDLFGQKFLEAIRNYK